MSRAPKGTNFLRTPWYGSARLSRSPPRRCPPFLQTLLFVDVTGETSLASSWKNVALSVERLQQFGGVHAVLDLFR